jgi:hypothetical protein
MLDAPTIVSEGSRFILMECCRPIPQIVPPVTTNPEYLIPDSGTPESST